MRKAERLLYILALLRTNPYYRASDLAEKCGVTERTIYRDIISISAANIPIYFNGGYKLLHEEFLPPLSLSPEETEFLLELLKLKLPPQEKIDKRIAMRIVDKLKISSAQIVKSVS